jgi:hypothetical protein
MIVMFRPYVIWAGFQVAVLGQGCRDRRGMHPSGAGFQVVVPVRSCRDRRGMHSSGAGFQGGALARSCCSSRAWAVLDAVLVDVGLLPSVSRPVVIGLSFWHQGCRDSEGIRPSGAGFQVVFQAPRMQRQQGHASE